MKTLHVDDQDNPELFGDFAEEAGMLTVTIGYRTGEIVIRVSAEDEEELRKFLDDRAKTPDQALWDQFTDRTKAVAGYMGWDMTRIVEYLSEHLKELDVPFVPECTPLEAAEKFTRDNPTVISNPRPKATAVCNVCDGKGHCGFVGRCRKCNGTGVVEV